MGDVAALGIAGRDRRDRAAETQGWAGGSAGLWCHSRHPMDPHDTTSSAGSGQFALLRQRLLDTLLDAGDTVMSPGTWEAVMRCVGAACAAPVTSAADEGVTVTGGGTARDGANSSNWVAACA